MALVQEEIPSISTDEATREFFGYLVEVDCGEEGSYGGYVSQVEPADNNLSTWGKMKLEKPFRNGVPLGEQLAIIVPGQLITNIKIINMPPQLSQPKQLEKATKSKNNNNKTNKNVEIKGSKEQQQQQNTNYQQKIQSSSVVPNVGNFISAHCSKSTYQGTYQESSQNKKQEKTVTKNNNKNNKNVEKKSKEHQKINYRQKIQSSNADLNVGDLASIHCSDGTYQGVVNAINSKLQTIRLGKPMLNGHPLFYPFIDLPHNIMKGVKFYPDDRNGHNRHLSRELRRPKIFEGVYMQSLPVASVQRKQPQQQSERRSDNISKVKADSEVETRSPTQLAHMEYGEYKKFTEQQIPFPVKLQLNATPKRHHSNHNNSGPTGIPTIDCINGYRGYGDKSNVEDTMGDALDYETLNTDFDFDANLKLFDKAAFTNQVDHVALSGLNSSGTNSRNYKNDENIVLDSSRVISWTTKSFVPSSSAVKNSTGMKVAHSLKPCPHHRH